MHLDLSDLVAIRKLIKQKNPDIIICAGDFTIFGGQQDEMLHLLNDLGKPLYMIHGNHEEEDDLRIACNSQNNITFVHRMIKEHSGVTFVFYGGGGFSKREKDFTAFVKKNHEKIKGAKKLVLITHAPPQNTAVDQVVNGMHVGVKDFRDFIEEYKPNIVLSGHIHETYKKKERLGKTLVMNPGWDGEVFEV